MSRIILAFAGAVALGLGACDSPSGSLTIVTDPDEVRLYVGESAPLVTQVLTPGGNLAPSAVTYWSQDLRVARVGGDGTVWAVAPGSTVVMAGYQTMRDSVVVTVQRDTRAQVHRLDIIPTQVSGATGGSAIVIPYVATDGYARTHCAPPGFTLRMNAALASVYNSSSGDVCSITVYPATKGSGYLVASVDEVSDSVLVTVENGAYSAAFTEAALATAQAGVSRPVRVRIVTAGGDPVPARAVQFSVSLGRLAQSSAVTDSTGHATVTWTPPTQLFGSINASLLAQTSFPTGATAVVSGQVRVVAGPPTALEWFSLSGYYYSYQRIVSGSLTMFRQPAEIYAIGHDVYGNQTTALPQVTYRVLTSGMKLIREVYLASCGTDVPPQYIYSCSAGFGFNGTEAGRIRIYATIPGLPSDSVDLIYQ
jgi:hypothetical protein